MRLFSVFLGGRADKCNIELHDVVFTLGEKIEDCYSDLLGKWFGLPDRLHIDSWVEINMIEGYKISLSKEKNKTTKKLYFVNLGAYEKDRFEELHESRFMVDVNKINVKKRAKKQLLIGKEQVHLDDLYDVDDCIEIRKVCGYYINLEKTSKKGKLIFNNGFKPIPKNFINNFKELNKQ
tara:strand:+ start:811 stop:1347 length:537 start_codon:yes stop_codon:yes gene_type:complete